ncbi:insulin-like growth factor-binding protein complex acid labile subunit [Periplaneta americana]|uniref:insulin-like growth factor-binding protein complex acid labile subunit n=1 Tax=Periplaneta americana TaxID=6978 RepID=UPI0037E7AA8A
MASLPRVVLLLIINLLSGCIAATVCPAGVCNCTKELNDNGGSDLLFNCSGNGLPTVPQNLDRNATILDLSNNDIAYLRNDTFNKTGVLHLHKVYFKQNRISGIESGTFKTAVSLSELDLESNLLAKILPGTFSHNPQLVILNLRNNSLTSLPVDVMTLTNHIKELYLGHNSITVVDTAEVEKYYPELRRLDVSKNQISRIVSTNPVSQSSLEIINASYNYIARIDPGTFSNARKLKDVDLSNNDVSSLGEDTFVNNSDLVRIDISRNHIITIHRNAFRNNPNITEINAGYNKMTYLHPDTFSKNPLLTKVTVSWNDIRKIQPGTFSNNPLLESIDFNTNKIQAVHSSAFTNNPNLKSVDLSSNAIISLHPDTFTNNEKLEYLFLNKNQHMRVLDGLVIRASTLKIFDMQHCNLTELPKGLLSNTSSLKELNLGNNNLTTIANLTNPENSQYVDTLTKLEVLDLSNNQMQTINVEVFSNNITKLKTLHIAGNPFLCDCKLRRVWLWSQKQGIIPREPQINCTNVQRESVYWGDVEHLDCEEEEESPAEDISTVGSTSDVPGCDTCTEKYFVSPTPNIPQSRSEDRGNKILVGVSLFFLLLVILVILPLLFIMRRKYGTYKVTKPKPRIEQNDEQVPQNSPGQTA